MMISARDSQSYTEGIITSTTECFEGVMARHWSCCNEQQTLRKKAAWVIKKQYELKLEK